VSAPPTGDHDNDPGRRNVANLVALIAVLLLAIVGYWAFAAIDKQRKLQNCLDSGRRNCVDYVGPAK
jgi:hypothetical protein